MPRNSSGTYSLYTPGNPVVTNTVISSTWANNTLADLASALTDSLSRTGDGGMQAPLELTNGAVGAPALTWGAETVSGLYRVSAGVFNYSISAADVLSMSAGGFVFGGAAGSYQGAGTINAAGLYDDGVLITNQSGANPSASVGLSAVNGVAATFMRSDAAPALSQSISPTMTGAWVFSSSVAFTNAASAEKISLRSADTDGDVYLAFRDSALARKGYFGYGNAGNDTFFLANEENSDIQIQTNGSTRVTIAAGGNVTYTGVQLGPAGAVGAPTWSFSGASNYGFYQASSDLFMSLAGTGYLVGFRAIPRSTTATTFALADVGRCVAVSAAINIPASVFAAGDAISVYNDSGSAVNITISAGTLRLAGTATTGTRSLAARGVATLWFNVGGATPEVIASGNVS